MCSCHGGVGLQNPGMDPGARLKGKGSSLSHGHAWDPKWHLSMRSLQGFPSVRFLIIARSLHKTLALIDRHVPHALLCTITMHSNACVLEAPMASTTSYLAGQLCSRGGGDLSFPTGPVKSEDLRKPSNEGRISPFRAPGTL